MAPRSASRLQLNASHHQIFFSLPAAWIEINRNITVAFFLGEAPPRTRGAGADPEELGKGWSSVADGYIPWQILLWPFFALFCYNQQCARFLHVIRPTLLASESDPPIGWRLNYYATQDKIRSGDLISGVFFTQTSRTSPELILDTGTQLEIDLKLATAALPLTVTVADATFEVQDELRNLGITRDGSDGSRYN